MALAGGVLLSMLKRNYVFQLKRGEMANPCYFQDCLANGTTKEHIPPRSFFPTDQRHQLMTVKSCERHNNKKSSDDIYVLAQICMNASPHNRSREVFRNRVLPQLRFNGGALAKTLCNEAERLVDGTVRYKVDNERFDRFFTALSYGIVCSACGASLPSGYTTGHIYHNLQDDAEPEEEKLFKHKLLAFYDSKPMAILDFGRINALNSTVYSAKVFGVQEFMSSITIRHVFFGMFHVTSMLTKRPNHVAG
jgi:hypothetical protein